MKHIKKFQELYEAKGKYKPNKFVSEPIKEGEIVHNPNGKPGYYNSYKILSINGNICKIVAWESLGMGHSVGHPWETQTAVVQYWKDHRGQERHTKQEKRNELAFDVSKEVGVDKIKGGSLKDYKTFSELIKYLEKFKTVTDKYKESDSWVASAPNSSTFRASRSGTPVSYSFNDVHHGGYYAGSTPYLVQVRIGGGINFEVRQSLMDVAKSILSKFTYESEYGKSGMRETDGTNWWSWMITAPRKGDSYNIIPRNFIK